MRKKRLIKDRILQGITYVAASLSFILLTLVIAFVVYRGSALLSFDLLVSDYNTKEHHTEVISDDISSFEAPSLEDGEYFSERYGVAFKDGKDREGDAVIDLTYVDEDSPFRNLHDKDRDLDITLTDDYQVSRISFEEGETALTRMGAKGMVDRLESGDTINSIVLKDPGGGIRGSLVATLYLIGLTLLLALPIGITTAIYLNEFAPPNRLTRTIRSFIDTLTGVPSIVYGLMAVVVFIPITVKVMNANGTNIYAGAMTMAVILLPVLIKTVEETLAAVPDRFRHASIALGATDTQTMWRVVLPVALPGILTATFLSVGRIIGESAALIFVMGTAVRDSVDPANGATTLAVHIWSLMSREPANVELASTIAMIILIVVLILNTIIKLIAKKFDKIGVTR
ncbi:MAG: phosphate ABC transporter permease PstA [Bacillota bacterium]